MAPEAPHESARPHNQPRHNESGTVEDQPPYNPRERADERNSRAYREAVAEKRAVKDRIDRLLAEFYRRNRLQAAPADRIPEFPLSRLTVEEQAAIVDRRVELWAEASGDAIAARKARRSRTRRWKPDPRLEMDQERFEGMTRAPVSAERIEQGVWEVDLDYVWRRAWELQPPRGMELDQVRTILRENSRRILLEAMGDETLAEANREKYGERGRILFAQAHGDLERQDAAAGLASEGQHLLRTHRRRHRATYIRVLLRAEKAIRNFRDVEGFWYPHAALTAVDPAIDQPAERQVNLAIDEGRRTDRTEAAPTLVVVEQLQPSDAPDITAANSLERRRLYMTEARRRNKWKDNAEWAHETEGTPNQVSERSLFRYQAGERLERRIFQRIENSAGVPMTEEDRAT
jgi:hypothetical protein